MLKCAPLSKNSRQIMQILKNIDELKAWRNALNANSLGFVPTMGPLHAGHASLIKQAVNENDAVIASVFVNPTQFLANEDYNEYPRKQNDDIALVKGCGASAIFLPDASEFYMGDDTLISAPKELASVLEGQIRPGHFDGVCRVLNKFFNLIKPKRAYFGKKDAQQLLIVQKMVKDFFMDIEIKPCDIVREADGLAISSRNAYLNDGELLDALKLSRALKKAKSMVDEGKLASSDIKNVIKEILEPLEIDYIAITDKNLSLLDNVELGNTLILLAVRVGKTRLIDNLWL